MRMFYDQIIAKITSELLRSARKFPCPPINVKLREYLGKSRDIPVKSRDIPLIVLVIIFTVLTLL